MAKKEITKPAVNPDRSKDIRKSITKPERWVYRTTTTLASYKLAVQIAESIPNPQRYQLYQHYKACELDAHLSAAVQQRKNLTLGSEFCVFNPDGSENEEKTKLIQTKWFRDFLDIALDSIYYGFSLAQFDSLIDVNGHDEFKCVELVPRLYVKPEFNIVTKDVAGLIGDDFTEKPWRNWTIGVGKPRDLGLFLKAAPLVIWKKDALGAWAEFIERFGVPILVGKTNARDQETRSSMETMLRNVRTGLSGVLDENESLEPIELNQTDAFQVFDQMIQRCNSEISKLILGQTMTLDDGSSKSQAQVHENVVDGYEDLDDQFIRSVLNYQLVPLMNNLGFGLEGMTIGCEHEDEWSLTEKSTFDTALINSGKYKLSPEYLKEKYNTEVEEIEEPTEPAQVKTIKNKLDELYK